MVEKKEDLEEEKERVLAWKKRREARKLKRQREPTDESSPTVEKDEDDFSNLLMDNITDDKGDGHDSEQEGGAHYVPLSKRKKMETETVQKHRRRFRQKLGKDDGDDENDSDADHNGGKNKKEENEEQQQVESLLESAAALQQSLTNEQKEQKVKDTEEARIMREASKVQT